ncbi:MAG: ribosomal RNA small subunit methyltransferase A [Bdellovibrionaceae bacterium]|nr:ribosomal RNA small subunit methyltransferase A [Pseudobdellovibrionaceae bacterium]
MTVKERLDQFFAHYPVEAKKALGQNFLVSEYAVSKMIAALNEFSFESLIEIGPGPGALTDILRTLKKNLTVLELDDFFFQYWAGQNISAIHTDALQWDWKKNILNPGQTILISNLPYQISSSIVIDRSMDETPLQAMILMFQKEVAQKIRMKSKTSEFGMLSVIAQTFWDIETVCDLSPRDFLPAPKVASRVLSFKAKRTVIESRPHFLTFCKAGFAQKRKLLKKNLLTLNKMDPEKIIASFQKLNLNETSRAEELAPEQWVALYKDLGFK